MKKLLVTGASGFLGWNLCTYAREFYNVTGIYHQNCVTIENVAMILFDLRNVSSLKTMFDSIKPDALIHAAAASDPNYCQQHKRESELLNIDVSVTLAELCMKRSIPFVFTSTDLVFDGTIAPYDEQAAVSPINAYGEQKSAAEKKILAMYADAVICRMPLMFGDAPPKCLRFLQLWIQQIKSGKKLSLFTDEYRTPVSAADACKGLLIACEKMHGILHLGGHERISRYDFGRMLIQLLAVTDDAIIGCKQSDVPMAAPRPKDVSLNSNKAFALGYNPGSIYQELKKLDCIKGERV
jgi:dTDP-4-dehydrorhamnose reductase